ncbi:MAG: SBBP repeat-containing protein [Verrucomicrobia subdivision 3 bacterium]|nr:SBBP repeat-containing protein [Limisphaerales bacterium]
MRQLISILSAVFARIHRRSSVVWFCILQFALCTLHLTAAEPTLAEALDATNAVFWTTDGDSFWFGQTLLTHDGVDAAQCGFILDGEQVWLEIVVPGPELISFWWMVSSEQGFDFLEFRINGVLQSEISGDVDWEQKSYQLADGPNTLRWRYYKDELFEEGLDRAWVDQFEYTPASGPPIIIGQPQGATVLAGDNAFLSVNALGAAPLSFQWLKAGQPVIDSGRISGANSATLSILNAQTNDSGSYRVSISNAQGSALSSPATLTVVEPGPSRAVTWARQLGGTNCDEVESIAVDPQGNVFVLGTFAGSITIGNTNLVSSLLAEPFGFLEDVNFLAKFDANGTWQWAIQLGERFFGELVGVDGAGAVVVAGDIEDALQIGTTNLMTEDGALVLVKIDGQGRFVWARQYGGSFYDSADALAVDAAGNIYFAGQFDTEATFGPFRLTNNIPNEFGAYEGLFLMKASSNGTPLWVIGSPGGGFNGGDLAVDADGNVLWASKFSEIAQLGTNVLSELPNEYYSEALFLARINGTGGVVWAESLGPCAPDTPLGVAFGPGGTAWLAGAFEGSAMFGTTTLNGVGTPDLFSFPADIFVARFGPAGNLVWARRYGGPNDDIINGLVTDADGNAYLSGAFDLRTDLDGFLLFSITADAGFAAAIDPTGAVRWVTRLSNDADADTSKNIGIDSAGSVYVADHFDYPLMLGGATLVPRGSIDEFDEYCEDLFLVKLAGGPMAQAVRLGNSLRISWPNSWTNMTVEATAELGSPWTPVSVTPTVSGAEFQVDVPIGPGKRFFRLRGPM